MAKTKKKLLPRDFDALLKAGDMAALRAVFIACDVDARGFARSTALGYVACPDDLARWLVAQGADLEARGNYEQSPLLARAGSRYGRIDVLLELGADIQAVDASGDTPLHKAAAAGNVEAVRALLQHGARADIRNQFGLTPLEWALQRCSNIDIEGMSPIAELLLDAAPTPATGLRGLTARLIGGRANGQDVVTPEMKAAVQRIGANFEFHRPAFAADMLDGTDAALQHLYRLFGVQPVARRMIYDGTSPIVARAQAWEDRHQELWELLVPSNGAATTVQGEVIRLSGRIRTEIEFNGCGNWDADYRKMADALLCHLGSGVPLPAPALAEADGLMQDIKRKGGDTRRMCQLATVWVGLNPEPIELPPPAYTR